MSEVPLERVDETEWEIPRRGAMRVAGRVFASEKLLAGIRGDPCLEQVQNVAALPGIVGHSLGMPDIHWGYGFPIGGVAAFDPGEGGVISPGPRAAAGARARRPPVSYTHLTLPTKA